MLVVFSQDQAAPQPIESLIAGERLVPGVVTEDQQQVACVGLDFFLCARRHDDDFYRIPLLRGTVHKSRDMKHGQALEIISNYVAKSSAEVALDSAFDRTGSRLPSRRESR